MQLAIAAVSAGGMSVREAARRYGVPRTTLQRKLSKDAAGGGHHTGGAGSRSNSITSPGAGSDSASPTSSNHEHLPSMRATPPSRASSSSSVAAATPNSIAAAISSAIDANQSTMNTILGLYESNGNGTTPLAASSSMSRKRSADAMNAPEKQQPVSKGRRAAAGLLRFGVACSH